MTSAIPSTSTSTSVTPKINLPNSSSSSTSNSNPNPNTNITSNPTSTSNTNTTSNPPTPIFDGLPLSPISQLSLSSLLSLLDTIPEAKTLMLDPSLAGPLGLIADVNSLRQHGVEKMFWLEEEKANTPKERIDLIKEKPIPRNVNSPTRAVVYICRPERRWIRVIASHILSDRQTSSSPNNLSHTYTALLTPRRTELSLLTLSQCGDNLFKDLTIHDFGLEFVPLEKDLLSLEEGSSSSSSNPSPSTSTRGDAGFSKIFKDGDHTILHHSAMALMTLQLVFGLFPRILGKGEAGKRLSDLLLRQRREHLASDPSNPALTNPSSVIDSLIIIDRSVDLATPLCSQLTYEGLIDEVIGIKSAHVEVDPNLFSGSAPPPSTPSGSGVPLQSTQPTKKKKHRLDSTSDSIFSQLRDSNFTLVPSKMHSLARKLREDFEGRHATPMSSQHRLFVSKLGSLTLEKQNLGLHTFLQEEIINETSSEDFLKGLEIQQSLIAGNYSNTVSNSFSNVVSGGVGGGGNGGKDDVQNQIEELINSELELNKVLRLLCLNSIINGGIKNKNLEFVKREILQTYGYEHLTLLLNLNKVGLLTKDSNSSSSNKDDKEILKEKEKKKQGFMNVRKALKLVDDEVDELNPKDISYVYSGYAPLSIRLVQSIAQKEALVENKRNQNQNQNSNDSNGNGNNGPLNENSLKSKPRAHPIVGWKGFQEIVDCLPGPTFDEIQKPFNPSSLNSDSNRSFINENSTNSNDQSTNVNNGSNSNSNSSSSNTSRNNSDPNKITTTLVFFLGGVTFAEISALRFMSSKTRNRRFLIATTGIISGDGLIEGLK